MTILRLLVMRIILLSVVALPNSKARAQFSAVTFTGFNVSASMPATVGYSFTANVDILVLALSYYDFNGDGLGAAHPVGLWNSSHALIAQATVSSGTASPLQDSFRFSAIPPIQLLAGQTYFVAGFNTGGSDLYVGEATGFSPNSAITFGHGVGNSNSSGLQFPIAAQGFDPSVFGGSLILTENAVPEPSVLALALISVVALIAFACRRATRPLVTGLGLRSRRQYQPPRNTLSEPRG